MNRKKWTGIFLGIKTVVILFSTILLINLFNFPEIINWFFTIWSSYIYGRALGEKVIKEELNMTPDSTDFEAMVSSICPKCGLKYKYRYDEEDNYVKYCPECEGDVQKEVCQRL